MRTATWLSIVGMLFANATTLFAQRFLEQLENVIDAEQKAEKKLEAARRPGYLGLVAVVEGEKVKVDAVRAGTAAERAGVRVGDVITAIDGGNIASLDDMGAALANRFANDRVAIGLTRGDKRGTLQVILGERPADSDDAGVSDVPVEPDPFAPDLPPIPEPPDAEPNRPAEGRVDALDALRNLEALLDEEAAAEPPAREAPRKAHIEKLEGELKAIQDRMRDLEREIAELVEKGE
jgi:membrane-associated protease RseP (regulator of RpoE activity)